MLTTPAASSSVARVELTPPRPLVLVAIALPIGAFSGLVGAGGGFLVVPALVLAGGLPMHRAVGTSLVVIALQSMAGLAGHLSHVTLDLHITLALAALSALGAAIGASLAPRLPAAALRRGFALLLILVATLFVHAQLPPGHVHWVGVGAVLIGGGLLWWRRPSVSHVKQTVT